MQRELVLLNVVGITYNQIENGVYALVLEEEGGGLRLPIIIGYSEAQAIECLIQKIDTPRPLTHEFTARILEAFDVEIESVVINLQPDGIFTADVSLKKGMESNVIDARSSDAIALAMRLDAPIFTTREVLEKAGIEKDSIATKTPHITSSRSIPARQAIARVKNSPEGKYAGHSEEQLFKMMAKAVEEEDYEKADEIKSEIESRKKRDRQ